MMLKAAPSLAPARVRGARPFAAPRSTRAVQVRADGEQNGVVASGNAAAVTLFKPLPPLVWTKDSETIRDVFAFGGSAPERVNGRVAMWAFASFAATELSSHTPVLEQFASGWAAAVLFSMTITFASITPKLLSGTSLKDLHAGATSDNMRGDGFNQVVALFDTNAELWAGRLAMIGVAGLAALETVQGDALF
mmetsp:Transcript_35007/g.88647  ORF Transcript_35007/g.88647 Transcript_35007/m.88647 type:complete len:193 (-) Transcript_35007:554-1132(-)